MPRSVATASGLPNPNKPICCREAPRTETWTYVLFVKLIGLQVLHRHFKANGKKDKIRMENGMNKMYKLLEMSSIE